MKQLYCEFMKSINAERLMRHTKEIYLKKFGQTFTSYNVAANKVLEIMQREKIPNAEIIQFSADGKSTFFDVFMPIVWDVEIGRLTVFNLRGEEECVVADWFFGVLRK